MVYPITTAIAKISWIYNTLIFIAIALTLATLSNYPVIFDDIQLLGATAIRPQQQSKKSRTTLSFCSIDRLDSVDFCG